MTPFEIYLMLTLDKIVGLLFGAAFVCFIATAVSAFIFNVADKEINGEAKKEAKKALSFAAPLLAFFCIAYVLTPSTKTAIAMYVIPPVVNSEAAQRIPDILNKSLDLIDKKLDESLGKKK